jgi:hypothetical protein
MMTLFAALTGQQILAISLVAIPVVACVLVWWFGVKGDRCE